MSTISKHTVHIVQSEAHVYVKKMIRKKYKSNGQLIWTLIALENHEQASLFPVCPDIGMEWHQHSSRCLQVVSTKYYI